MLIAPNRDIHNLGDKQLMLIAPNRDIHNLGRCYVHIQGVIMLIAVQMLS